jgi:hypothetical protein
MSLKATKPTTVKIEDEGERPWLSDRSDRSTPTVRSRSQMTAIILQRKRKKRN